MNSGSPRAAVRIESGAISMSDKAMRMMMLSDFAHAGDRTGPCIGKGYDSGNQANQHQRDEESSRRDFLWSDASVTVNDRASPLKQIPITSKELAEQTMRYPSRARIRCRNALPLIPGVR